VNGGLMAVLGCLASAPPPHFGGELTVISPRSFAPRGEPSDPCVAHHPADRVLRNLRYEPLYAADGTPILARSPPRIEGSELVVPLRSGVRRHGGDRLTAVDVERWLRSDARCLGLSPLLKGPAESAITSEPLVGQVRVRLSRVVPGIERLLHGPRAAVRVLGEGGFSGTGPFAPDPDRANRSVAFVDHHRGRPHLDAIRVRSARRGRPTAGSEHLVLDDSRELRTIWWLVQTPVEPDAVPAIDLAVDRSRLTGFVPFPAQPVGPVFGEGADARRTGRLDLVLPESVTVGFRERLQLDLFRAGIRAKIRSRPASKPRLELVASSHVARPGGAAAAVLRLMGRLGRRSEMLERAVAQGALEGRASVPLEALAQAGVVPLMEAGFGSSRMSLAELPDHWVRPEATP
jgi:hypothetical protein